MQIEWTKYMNELKHDTEAYIANHLYLFTFFILADLRYIFWWNYQ